MVVQHNLTAMNSNRMLNLTVKSQTKSTEKLSSGYKINRAADDAAGLSISEKMRKQIRGLTQASANAQDGISAVQTAEGALNEVQDMLQRMNELAVKAANGTNSTDDRTYIQNEIDQLVSEIDRVAETTKFNETYLLKGDKTVTEYKFGYAAQATNASINGYQSANITLYSDNAGTKLAATALGTKFDVANDGKLTLKTDQHVYDANGNEVTSGFDEYVDVTAVGAKKALYDANGNWVAENALDKYVKTADGSTITSTGEKLYTKDGREVTFAAGNFTAAALPAGPLTLKLHVGADATANNQISVTLKAMSAEGIGINGLKVDGSDDTNALKAIETIKAAIQKISTQRSALGAVQNRLDHTINNLDNVVENTTSAESGIRDTDMATEMVKYSNNNILAQAGQSMLAQANQTNQGVLSLLS